MEYRGQQAAGVLRLDSLVRSYQHLGHHGVDGKLCHASSELEQCKQIINDTNQTRLSKKICIGKLYSTINFQRN